jgi:tetratricopeptide (TPR) repeat protein
MWDDDTLEMEKQEFPSIFELITGKFIRHSEEFYHWRIKDREEKLLLNPNQKSLYDDLSVSYSKIHNNEKAIEIALKKEVLFPGEYETYANLGTFYIHNKQLKKGKTYIEKSIEINPDAHFGREVYQLHLVGYLLNRSMMRVLDSAALEDGDFSMNKNFYQYILYRYNEDLPYTEKVNILPKKEWHKAVKGIAGMMRFGNYNSPVLLEALGDILSIGTTESSVSSRHLAIRAYLKALTTPNSGRNRIKNKYASVVRFIKDGSKYGPSFSVKETLDNEIKVGEEYFQKIRNNEIKWIQNSSINPELMFRQTYYGNKNESINKSDTLSLEIPDNEQDLKDSVIIDMNTANNTENDEGSFFVRNSYSNLKFIVFMGILLSIILGIGIFLRPRKNN